MADVPIQIPKGSIGITGPTLTRSQIFSIPAGAIDLIETLPVRWIGPYPVVRKTSDLASFYRGQHNATFTITLSNESGFDWAGPTEITEVLPVGLELVSMGGDRWACVDNVCTRTDSLPLGEEFEPIIVNVSDDAPRLISNIAQFSTYNAAEFVMTVVDLVVPVVRERARWVLHQFNMKPRGEERA